MTDAQLQSAPPTNLKSTPIILVVDDEPDVLLSLGRVIELSLPGCRVLPAQSGREAFEILNRERVDVVVADFKMPGMNGLDFLTAVRDSTKDVARILITAFPAVGLAVRAINEAQVHSFFVKPFDGMRLVESVRAALAERSSRSTTAKVHA